MLLVVGKIIFIYTQAPDTKFGFLSSDAIDCYVYGVPVRSTNVIG